VQSALDEAGIRYEIVKEMPLLRWRSDALASIQPRILGEHGRNRPVGYAKRATQTAPATAKEP
jgi:hypothetical protein